MRKIFIIVLLLFCTVAQAEIIATEESVKTAFIFRFINFIDWEDHEAGYTICIPEDKDFRDSAAHSLSGKVVNGRTITVVSQAPVCHIVISDNVPATDGVLTIGPLQKGALMEFRVVDNKLKFAVSLEKVKESRLKISSQLLKLAILEQS